MSFRIEKLYTDLVTPDGTVCVAYVASLRAFGIESLHAGLEIYWPAHDGRGREIIHGRPSASPAALRESLTMSLQEAPGGPIVIELEPKAGAWSPRGAAPCPGLSWCVKIARANVAVRWLGDPTRPILRGLGYSDWVVIERPIRQLDLRLLSWGRVHLPLSTIVYDAIELGSGRTWMRAARWRDDGQLESEYEALRVESTAASTQLWLSTSTRASEQHPSVVFDTLRALHVGPAIDEARMPRAVERFVTRLFTGRADEHRALSRPRDGGWALHESVALGGFAHEQGIG